jgi:hypothetical protein
VNYLLNAETEIYSNLLITVAEERGEMMGKKYVIELEDEPFWQNDDPKNPHGVNELWKAKGFSSLVFNSEGLSRLTLLEDYIADQENHKGQVNFMVGNEVERTNDGKTQHAYVLIPNYGRDEDEIVLLMPDYAHPQIVDKKGWVESGLRSNIIVKMITEAASLIAQEDEPCQ